MFQEKKKELEPITPPPSTEPTAHHIVLSSSENSNSSLPDMEPTSDQLRLMISESDSSGDTITDQGPSTGEHTLGSSSRSHPVLHIPDSWPELDSEIIPDISEDAEVDFHEARGS